MAKIGMATAGLGLDFFHGGLPTYAGLSPQQLVAVGVLVALGVIGVRTQGEDIRSFGQRHRVFGVKT